MARLRGDGWLFIGLGIVTTLLELSGVWRLLGPLDWFLFSVLLVTPPLTLWRYLKVAHGPERQVQGFAASIAISGYVGIWFALGLAERVATR